MSAMAVRSTEIVWRFSIWTSRDTRGWALLSQPSRGFITVLCTSQNSSTPRQGSRSCSHDLPTMKHAHVFTTLIYLLSLLSPAHSQVPPCMLGCLNSSAAQQDCDPCVSPSSTLPSPAKTYIQEGPILCMHKRSLY
jgi:hypothetical protein